MEHLGRLDHGGPWIPVHPNLYRGDHNGPQAPVVYTPHPDLPSPDIRHMHDKC